MTNQLYRVGLLKPKAFRCTPEANITGPAHGNRGPAKQFCKDRGIFSDENVTIVVYRPHDSAIFAFPASEVAPKRPPVPPVPPVPQPLSISEVLGLAYQHNKSVVIDYRDGEGNTSQRNAVVKSIEGFSKEDILVYDLDKDEPRNLKLSRILEVSVV